jgi:hypothetical protein
MSIVCCVICVLLSGPNQAVPTTASESIRKKSDDLAIHSIDYAILTKGIVYTDSNCRAKVIDQKGRIHTLLGNGLATSAHAGEEVYYVGDEKGWIHTYRQDDYKHLSSTFVENAVVTDVCELSNSLLAMLCDNNHVYVYRRDKDGHPLGKTIQVANVQSLITPCGREYLGMVARGGKVVVYSCKLSQVEVLPLEYVNPFQSSAISDQMQIAVGGTKRSFDPANKTRPVILGKEGRPIFNGSSFYTIDATKLHRYGDETDKQLVATLSHREVIRSVASKANVILIGYDDGTISQLTLPTPK